MKNTNHKLPGKSYHNFSLNKSQANHAKPKEFYKSVERQIKFETVNEIKNSEIKKQLYTSIQKTKDSIEYIKSQISDENLNVRDNDINGILNNKEIDSILKFSASRESILPEYPNSQNEKHGKYSATHMDLYMNMEEDEFFCPTDTLSKNILDIVPVRKNIKLKTFAGTDIESQTEFMPRRGPSGIEALCLN